MSSRNVLLSADCARFTSALHAAGYEVALGRSGDTLLDIAERIQPGIVAVGWLESANRIHLISRLLEVTPQAAVVMFFDRPDEAELMAILHAGAIGYLPADIPPQRLLAALKGVQAGEPAITRSSTAALVRQLRSPGRTSIRTHDGTCVEMSDREWDVLCYLAQGYTTKEIADRLFVSPGTVRSHVFAVVHKLGVTDRDAALDVIFSAPTVSTPTDVALA